MPRDAFEGYDEPVNIDMEPEEAMKLMLDAGPHESLTTGSESSGVLGTEESPVSSPTE